MPIGMIAVVCAETTIDAGTGESEAMGETTVSLRTKGLANRLLPVDDDNKIFTNKNAAKMSHAEIAAPRQRH